MNEVREDNLFNHLFRTIACWLVMARKLHACKANSKVAGSWKISLVVARVHNIRPLFGEVMLSSEISIYGMQAGRSLPLSII